MLSKIHLLKIISTMEWWYKTYPSVGRKQKTEWSRWKILKRYCKNTYRNWWETLSCYAKTINSGIYYRNRRLKEWNIIREKRQNLLQLMLMIKLQLNNIEEEKVILISDNDREIYKENITSIIMRIIFSQ
jgi:hypothetical protein